MSRSFRPSITRILVELGETNMRCAIMENGDLRDMRVFKLGDHASLVEAVEFYCRDVGFQREARMGLLVALAPQPKDGVYYFKHTPHWNFKPQDVMHALGLASIHLINDLESHAYAVLVGARGETLFEGKPRTDGPVAIVAPGTGLGFAYAYPELNYVQQALGGHMHFHGFGPDDETFRKLRPDLLYKQPTFEDIVSGPGLKIMRERIGDDAAYDYFARVFGLFIHNVVMYAFGVGGVVITGGLVPALLKEGNLDWAKVRDPYKIENIPAVADTLLTTPWNLIDDPLLGLKGLLAWAKVHIDT